MAFFQSFGRRPWVTDRLKHILKGFATKLANSFSNLGCSSSGPVDLPMSSLTSRPKTSSSLMVTLSSACVGGFSWTGEKGVSMVYRLLKYF